MPPSSGKHPFHAGPIHLLYPIFRKKIIIFDKKLLHYYDEYRIIIQKILIINNWEE